MNKPITEEQKETIRRMYPNTLAKDIASTLGLTYVQVKGFAWRQRLKHDSVWFRKMTARNVTKYNRTPAMRQEASRKRLILFKQERRRALFGERKKTKLRISLLPKKVRQNKYSLCYKYGYFSGGDPNSTTLYFDSQTRRNARSEEYSKRVYGIRFEQGDE